MARQSETSRLDRPSYSRLEKMIPYSRQWISEKDQAHVRDVMNSRMLTRGPLANQFTDELARFAGVKHCVLANSGTSALHLAYLSLELSEEDEIITTPLTFFVTASMASLCGAKVVFADVDPTTGLIDPESVAQLVTPRTKVIVAVDYAGHPADYEKLSEISKKSGAFLMADAAHSFGGSFRGDRVGSLADPTILSFHPVKSMTTAEGGAILTDSPRMARRAARLASQGVIREMEEGADPWLYDFEDLGLNYRLSDFQSALGLSQLQRLETFIKRRRKIATIYRRELSDLEGLDLPFEKEGALSAWHLFVVRLKKSSLRRQFFERLISLGLGVQVHYRLVYHFSYYQKLGYREGLCPNAEDFYSRIVSLPLFPKMTEKDIDFVVERVRKAYQAVKL